MSELLTVEALCQSTVSSVGFNYDDMTAVSQFKYFGCLLITRDSQKIGERYKSGGSLLPSVGWPSFVSHWLHRNLGPATSSYECIALYCWNACSPEIFVAWQRTCIALYCVILLERVFTKQRNATRVHWKFSFFRPVPTSSPPTRHVVGDVHILEST